MKQIQLLVIALCCSLLGAAQVVNQTFDDATAISGWAGIADATGPEASIAYDAAGNGTGALSVTAINPDDGIGKAYIFQTTITGLDFSGSTDYTVTFDLKSSALVGAAVHLQTTLPGAGTVNNFDLQTGGLNDANWTPYSFSFSGVDTSSDAFTIHFNLAAGAFVGAGGTLLVDNIVLSAGGGTGGTPGCTDNTAVNYDAAATTDDGSCLYEMTFEVDMSAETGFTTPAVESPLFGWCGGCAPMADMGGGIWAVTLQLPAGAFEYKYAVDSFASQEDLVDDVVAGNGSCAPITDGSTYANRQVTVVAGSTQSDIYGTCGATGGGDGCTDPTAVNYNAGATTDDGSCLYEMTFEVDMSAETGFTTPAVESPLFGWCGGCAPMVDMGSGIWSVTLQLPAGDFEYKYAVDDFASQEDLLDDVIAGNGACAPVTDGSTYANRQVTVVAGSTQSDIYGTCGAAPATANITFQVDMNEYAGPETISYINVSGEWNGWCGDCNQMTDADLDGIWTVTLPIEEGNYFWKYSINNWADDEDMTGAGSCAVQNGDFWNRTLSVTAGADQTLDVVCFGSCYACTTGETPGCTNVNASNYDAAATVNDGSCLFDVTFHLNTTTSGVDFSAGAHIFGAFNGWCGGCAPMVDDGDGTWSLTVELQEGSYEYKYSADATNTVNESLDISMGDCVVSNFGFTNRVLQVMDDMVLDLVCWQSCSDCAPGEGCTDATANNYDPAATVDNGSCLYNVIFTVDMNQYGTPGVDFTTPEVNGSFNGWCGGCNPMADPEGDNIWTATIELGPGTYEYQFAVDSWTDQEFGLDPAAPCTIGANRFVDVSGQTDIGLVCWESCGICVEPVFVNVTFRVDMSNETVSANGVHIAGAFQGWDPAASQMTYLGYGIYEMTFNVSGNQSYQFKYINGNDWPFEEVIPAECNFGGNREVAVGDVDLMVPVVCFGECTACAGCTDPFSAEYNPFAGSDDGSCATAIVFGCTYDNAENYDAAATTDDGSCTFAPAVNDCPEDLDGDTQIGTSDLLIVLAAFGGSCP